VRVSVSETYYRLEAVDRVVDVLSALERKPESGLAEIARNAGLHEATTLRYLASLMRHEIVERVDGTRRYRLGPRLFELGQHVLSTRDPRGAAMPFMRQLLMRFDETVNLCMRQESKLVLIESLESTQSVRMGARVGQQDVWYASGLGKAILAELPDDEVRRILGRSPYPRRTVHTFTTTRDLRAELRRTRERGYAVDDEESQEGLRCVAACVFDHRGQASYAISLSGPAMRFSPEVIARMGSEVATAAADLSLRLGYSAAIAEGGGVV
jgi:DNA-binding IclR family transcriptional regulator